MLYFDPRFSATGTVSRSSCTYVASEPGGSRCAIIDSVLDYDPKSGRASTASVDRVIEYVCNNALTVDWILETHAHTDHLIA